MNLKPTILVLVAALALLLTPKIQGQTTSPPYLSQFPSLERIKADVRGVDAMETAAKQAGIFWQLRQLVYDLALSQRRTDRHFTPDEQRLEVEYRNAHYKAIEPFEGKVTGADKPKWFALRGKYEMDLWLRDEVLKKYFTPELRRTVYVALKGQMPTQNAPEQSRLTPPAGSATADANPRTTSGSTTPPSTPIAPAAESAAARVARERLERESARIEEENRKIAATNEIVARTFKAGNEAINAGQYDEAIAQYREGLAVRPDEPALLTNLSEALIRRGVDRFNVAVRDEDRKKRDTGTEAAKKDWSEAAQASRKAVNVIKGAPASDPVRQQSYAHNRLAALSAYARAMRLVATKVDYTQGPAAWEAYQEYLAVETDPAKKTRYRVEALQMLFDAGSADLAVAEARKILASEPNHVDAIRVLGLALFASGDKKNFQEAADALQRYLDLAPDTDLHRESGKEALDYLKTAETITPRRGQATRSPSRRRP